MANVNPEVHKSELVFETIPTAGPMFSGTGESMKVIIIYNSVNKTKKYKMAYTPILKVHAYYQNHIYFRYFSGLAAVSWVSYNHYVEYSS